MGRKKELNNRHNIINVIISIVLVLVIFTIIYLIHNLAFKQYTYNTKYTYICDKYSCKHDDIRDLHIDLEKSFNDEETAINIINNISSISEHQITSKEVISSIDINRSGKIIDFKIKN